MLTGCAVEASAFRREISRSTQASIMSLLARMEAVEKSGATALARGARWMELRVEKMVAWPSKSKLAYS